MKRFILATCLAFCAALPLAQAGGSDFFLEDREAKTVSAEISTPATKNRSTDASNQDYGVPTGKPIVRLDSRYGDISVETIFGKVNGAQVRVTW